MTAIWNLEDFLEDSGTKLVQAAYPCYDGSLISSLPFPEVSEFFEHQKSRLMDESKIRTKIFESQERMSQTGIYFLIQGENVEDSIINVANLSNKMKKTGDFKQRLIGAFVYHALLLSNELPAGATNEFLFPTSLRSHVSERHSNKEYLNETFYAPFSSRPVPIVICGEDENYLLRDMEIDMGS